MTIRIFFLLLISTLANAAEKNAISFNDSPLSAVAQTVTTLTNVPLSFGQDVSQKKISLFLPHPEDSKTVLQLFFSSIESNGFTVIPNAGGFQIVPANDKNNTFNRYSVFSLGTVPVDAFLTQLTPSIPKGSFAVKLNDYSFLAFGSPSLLYSLRQSAQIYANHYDPIVTRIVSFDHLSPDSVTALAGKENVIYDKTTNKYALTLPSRKLTKTLVLLNRLDSKPKNYRLEMIVASVSNQSIDNAGLSFLLTSGGLSTDTLSGLIKFNSVNPGTDAISAVANLLATKTDSRIINRPFLQIREGSPATFSRGQVVPFSTSQVSQTTGQIINTITRENVGLDLNANLSSNSSGLLLRIDEKLSSISPTQLKSSTDIITNSQSLTTTLKVIPGFLYAIGGTEDTETTKQDSLLSFLPVSKHTEQNDRQIVVFLTLSEINTTPQSTSPWWD